MKLVGIGIGLVVTAATALLASLNFVRIEPAPPVADPDAPFVVTFPEVSEWDGSLLDMLRQKAARCGDEVWIASSDAKSTLGPKPNHHRGRDEAQRRPPAWRAARKAAPDCLAGDALRPADCGSVRIAPGHPKIVFGEHDLAADPARGEETSPECRYDDDPLVATAPGNFALI